MINERDAFENWASSPPFEYRLNRFPEHGDTAWPGNYKDIAVQLAWEAWKQSRRDAMQECASLIRSEADAVHDNDPYYQGLDRACDIVMERMKELE